MEASIYVQGDIWVAKFERGRNRKRSQNLIMVMDGTIGRHDSSLGLVDFPADQRPSMV